MMCETGTSPLFFCAAPQGDDRTCRYSVSSRSSSVRLPRTSLQDIGSSSAPCRYPSIAESPCSVPLSQRPSPTSADSCPPQNCTAEPTPCVIPLTSLILH